jgi:hypothetical protein
MPVDQGECEVLYRTHYARGSYGKARQNRLCWLSRGGPSPTPWE